MVRFSRSTYTRTRGSAVYTIFRITDRSNNLFFLPLKQSIRLRVAENCKEYIVNKAALY